MKFKKFQREDLARAALHDGLVLGQDTGLGKTLCAYVWPVLKVGLLRQPNGQPVRPMTPAEPVLIVASGDLHEQIIAESLRHFHTRPTILDSQETFLRLSTLNSQPSTNNRRTLPPAFYLTTYTQLSRNGVTPFPELNRADPQHVMRLLNLRPADLEEFYAGRGGRYDKHYNLLAVTPEDPLPKLRSQWFKLRKSANQWMQQALDEAYYFLKDFAPPRATPHPAGLTDLTPDQQAAVTAILVSIAHKAMSANLGVSRFHTKTDREIKCLYSTSLADLCSESFAVVVADEGTKIKGEETLIGKGTRQMNPRFRLPMTATPIKNRLPDVFRLAHWSTGAHRLAHPRFPFGDEDAESFAEEFLVTERNLSAEDRAAANGGRRRFVKKTPQVCNIHRLWKLFGPIILRRRKTDCGEELVGMHRNVVRVPMGKEQAAVYQYHLEADYLDKNGRPAPGAKLQALRIAAANPTSALLQSVPGPRSTLHAPRSTLPYIPKLASALSLVHQILGRKEQVVVFSAFHDSLDALASRLHEAGVRHVVLDGRTSPARRGQIAAKFKLGPNAPRSTLHAPTPVLLAGVECMAEGHSFHLCTNVILMAYSWAYDRFIQAINRIWRLNSAADINVYSLICHGSIDHKLEANIQEKGDAAELVLDSQLLGDDPAEVNLAELLQIAQKEFASASLARPTGEGQGEGASFIDERTLEQSWPALRDKFARAMQKWGAASTATVAPPRPPAEPTSARLFAEVSDPAFADLPLWQRAA
jgi:hypothetical protein